MLPDLDSFASIQGLTSISVADLSELRNQEPEAMEQVTDDFSRAIVFGIRLEDAIIDQIKDRPTPLYFHMYRQANFALDRLAFKLALEIQSTGYRAMTIPASQIIDWDRRRGMVSHRLLGYTAGIGWIGRPTLLIHPEYGSRMRYASVLTDAPYKTGEPVEYQCGECTACIEMCPVNAIKQSSHRFDVDACYEKLSEFRKLPFIGQHVCGICVKACRGADCV